MTAFRPAAGLAQLRARIGGAARASLCSMATVGLVAELAACAGAAPRAKPGPVVADLPDSARNLVVLEFRDSPTQGLLVTGGMLAIPDSAGRFASDIVRYQPLIRHPGARGFGDGDRLVFTDLQPGTYRVALVDLEESGTVHRLITRKAPSFSEICRVYSDSIPALTFSVGHGEVRHLGRLVRLIRPSLSGDELWQTSFAWEAIDESRALKEMLKRKRLAPWHGVIGQRLAALDSLARAPAEPR